MNPDNKPLTRDRLLETLRGAGLVRGDVVLVQAALWPIGPVEAGSEPAAILDFYLSAFQEVLGPEGTLAVLTSFEDYGRHGTPFIVEESPSRNGVFTEFVRTRPGAVRSPHPLASVTALGGHAQELCGGPHYSGLGYDSPWGRLHRCNAKLLDLGLRFREIASFDHFIEAMYGVPYQYVKVFRHPVFAGGREISGPFTMSVRYLDFSIAYDTSRFEQRLAEKGLLCELALGRSVVQVTTAQAAFDLGIDALNEDRYFFLKEPPRFRPGEYPADGPTGTMKTVYHSTGPNISRKEGTAHV